MENPYRKYITSHAWDVIQKSLDELIDDEDVILQTASYLAIGYLCKALDDAGLLNVSVPSQEYPPKVYETEVIEESFPPRGKL